MPRGAGAAGAGLGVPVLCYEQLLDGQVDAAAGFEWPDVDENAPCGLCYTSGARCALHGRWRFSVHFFGPYVCGPGVGDSKDCTSPAVHPHTSAPSPPQARPATPRA